MKKTFGVLGAILLASCGGGSDSTTISDPNEPNDTMATATSIPADGAVSAAIGSGSDVDYYAITIPAGGSFVRIRTFDGSGSACGGIDPYVAVWTSSGMWVSDDDDTLTTTCEDLWLTLAEGTYYVEVGWSVLGEPPFNYVLDLTASALPSLTAETEANGTIATANGPFTSDARVSAAISPAGDEDYFAVENATASPQLVHFETSTGAGACSTPTDTVMRVFGAGGGDPVASDDDSGLNYCSALSYTIPAYTTVYVSVADLYVDLTIGFYELDINFQ